MEWEVDDSDLCFLDCHPLREILGIRTEEIDVRPEYMENQILYREKLYSIRELCALVHAETAEVLAEYQNDFYKGYPALTKHHYGKGTAYFIASENEVAFIEDFYHELWEEAGVACTLRAELPEGVTVSERKGQDGTSLWFVMNFNAVETEMEFRDSYWDIESGNHVLGLTKLSPYCCMILKGYVP